jgi:hypothetical protein
MNWYATALIVRCRVEGEMSDKPLFDRQIRVLRATDPECAFQRAMKLGEEQNHSYENSKGKKVFWEFVGLGDLCQLADSEINDGTEIFSRLDYGNPETEVTRTKAKLTVFWAEANMKKTARELLNEKIKQFAPR